VRVPLDAGSHRLLISLRVAVHEPVDSGEEGCAYAR
jgi:cyclic beta-1,2-glucan synthetase